MGALLDHPPVVEDDDAVGQMERGAAVGHQQRRPVGHDPAQAVVDGLFDLGVDGAGGVVEDQDARVGHDGPGQGDALALAAREGQAPLADDGVVAARAAARMNSWAWATRAAASISSSVASGRP